MKPIQTYRIWFSQRNGSTLLCKGLEQTGIAGKPGEFFNVMEHETLSKKYGTSTYEELLQAIWKLGSTPNGVFGIKHSMHHARFAKIFGELRQLQGIKKEESPSEEALMADLFPNCKHIYLTRRNKVRQAVSWWKAINDQIWHLEPGEAYHADPEFFEDKYDFDALLHLFKEANLRECAIQAYFDKFDIVPMTLVYEDMIQDFEGTVKKVLDYLDLSSSDVQLPSMFYQKTANHLSEHWVQRFREDLQSNWTDVVW